MWYVIQTITGAEENLVEMVHKIISKDYYTDCFCIKRECTKRSTERYQSYQVPLFPAYVFVETNCPRELYYKLKSVPKLTKILSREEEIFLSVSEEEQRFLENIQDEQHIVRRSTVKVNKDGLIISAEGPLGQYIDCIVKQRLRKRCVWIEQRFLGRKRNILLGIKLDNEEES